MLAGVVQYGEDAIKEGMGAGGGGGGGMADLFDILSGGRGGSRTRERKSDDVVHKLTVSLEELYNGVTKYASIAAAGSNAFASHPAVSCSSTLVLHAVNCSCQNPSTVASVHSIVSFAPHLHTVSRGSTCVLHAALQEVVAITQASLYKVQWHRQQEWEEAHL
jgi:hypothetical protein